HAPRLARALGRPGGPRAGGRPRCRELGRRGRAVGARARVRALRPPGRRACALGDHRPLPGGRGGDGKPPGAPDGSRRGDAAPARRRRRARPEARGYALAVKRLVVVAFAAVLFVAGCGGGDNEAISTDTATVTMPVVKTDIRVYFLRDGKVWPVRREVPETDAMAGAAVGQLLAGPTSQEKSDLRVRSAVSSSGHPDYDILVEGGVAKVD